MKKLIAFVLGLFVTLPAISAGLPSGYTELQYVTATSAVVNSNISIASNHTLTLDIDMAFASTSDSQLIGIFGGIYFGPYSGTFGIGNRPTNMQADTNRHRFVLSGIADKSETELTLLVDSTTLSTTRSTVSGLVGLLGLNQSGSYAVSGTIYSAKIYDNGELKGYFIPAKYGNKVGFYNTVTNTFLEPYTDGTLTAGPEVAQTNTCNNLFNEIYPNPIGTIQYRAIYVGDGKFTCSYDLPYQQGNSSVSMVYFLPGNVSAGASNEVNQVDAEHPRTVTAVNGYVTVAYRNGSGIRLGDAVPTDYHCKIERGETATTYCKYNMTKLATTKYNNAAFSGVVTALSNAVDTIKTVVANTINQATAVANLHSGKQQRPDESCPAGKTCLLVEDMNGDPHWYEIVERAPGIVPAGSGYTQVEYLQSDGNQYIDTGVFGSTGMAFEIDLAYVSGGYGYQMNGWGSDAQIGIETSTLKWWNMTRGVDAITYNTIYHTRLEITESKSKLYVDGILQTEPNLADTHTANGFGLFAANKGNGYAYASKEKIYAVRIFNSSGTLVRDFVPAQRNSDGVLGMYDTVNGQFYTNAGTGDFTGPVAQ